MSLTIENDTVLLEIVNDPVPLRIDEGGAIRIGKTRITLDTIVAAFNQGATAEEIVYRYPTLDIADVYAVISYYLRRREEIDDYLQKEQQAADEIRRKFENRYNSNGIRDRLLARRAKRETMETVEISG